MGGRRGTDKTYSLIESDVTPIGSVINLPGIDITKAHCFAGVQFFSDAAGETVATPTTGTVVISVVTLNTVIPENITSPTIDASLPTTVSWASNTRRVLATPNGVDVATHYKLVVTCNET